MADIFEKAIVQKRNVLNEMKATNFSLQELRFFTIYLSKINPYDKKTREVKFKLSDYQAIMGFGKLNIQQLKSSARSLLAKSLLLPTESGGFDGVPLFKRFKLDKDSSGSWYILIDVTDDILPLMFDFKDRYFKYELWNALQLHSTVQIRMYEILKQYENLKKREIDVEEFRNFLGIPANKYQRWERFRTQILDNCQNVLKEKTDIYFEYERGKTGKGGKWLTIIFYIYKNADYKKPLLLDKFINEEIVIDDNKEIDVPDETVPMQILSETEKSESKDIDFYRSACNDEFSENEIESILLLLNSIELPENVMGKNFAKYHFLLEQYTKFKAVAERTYIANRYRYFYSMIENERDKQM